MALPVARSKKIISSHAERKEEEEEEINEDGSALSKKEILSKLPDPI